MNLPITFGQRPLILIPSASKGFAIDRTAPTTACLETAYIRAMGNGYIPAFEAVHMIVPFCEDVFFRI
jgi:hypothetical protein